MIRAGKLLAEEALPAIGRAAEALAGGQVIEASRTLQARLARLTLEFELLQKAAIDGAEVGLGRFADELARTARESESLISRLGEISGESLAQSALELAANAEAISRIGAAITDLAEAGGINVDPDDKLPGTTQDLQVIADVAEFIRDVLVGARGVKIAAEETWRATEEGAEEAGKAIERTSKIVEQYGDISKLSGQTAVDALVDATKENEKLRRQLEETAAAAGSSGKAQVEAAEAAGKANRRAVESMRESIPAFREVAAERVRVFEEAVAEELANEAAGIEERRKAIRSLVGIANLAADERVAIESKALDRLSDLENKLAESRVKILREFEEFVKANPSKREEALEKSGEKLLALEEKIAQGRRDVNDKLLADIESAELKSLERRRKAQEKQLKDLQRLFKPIGDTDSTDVRTTEVRATGTSDEGLFREELLAPFIAKLEEAKKRFAELTITAGTGAAEITEEVRRLNDQMGQLALAGIPQAEQAFKKFTGSVSDSGREMTERIRNLVLDTEGFRDAVQSLSSEGSADLKRLIATYLLLSENTNITKADTAAFGEGLDAAFSKGGTAAQAFAEQLRKTQTSTTGTAAEISAALEAMVSELAPAKTAAAETGAVVEDLAGKLDEVASADKAAKIAGLAASFATLSTVLKEQGEGFEQLNVMAVALGKIAAPLETISANLPLLPPPLAALVASVIELNEAKALEPLTTALLATVEPVESLAENLPTVSLAVADLVTAATDSKEPLGDLQEALEAIGSEEVVTGLKNATSGLGELLTALQGLAGEKGFALVQSAAKALIEFLEGPFTTSMENASELISVDIQNAFRVLASVITETKTEAIQLAGVLKNDLPSAAEAGALRANKALDSIRVKANETAAAVQRVVDALKAMERERQAAG